MQKTSLDAMWKMKEANGQEPLLSWENLGDVLQRVGTERAEDKTTVA